MQHRRTRDRIQSELDAAFATVQSARARHELGYDGAGVMARDCVRSTAASIRKMLLQAGLNEVDNGLVEAKLRALAEAARRIPGPELSPVDGHEQAQPNWRGR